MARYLVYGPSGGGKTYFSVAPVSDPYDALVVDTEDRVAEFGVPEKNIIHTDVGVPGKPDPKDLFTEIQKRFAADKGLRRVVIDSLSNLQVQRQFAIASSGRLSGFDQWGQLKADFLLFVQALGKISRAGYDVICTAHSGEEPDPLWLPSMTAEIDPLNYKKPLSGGAPMIKVPDFDGSFQVKSAYYFDWLIYTTQVPNPEGEKHRYYFERVGMFSAKKPPTAKNIPPMLENTNYTELQKLLKGGEK